MQAQLSKLYVRFIQTQKSFFLIPEEGTKGAKLPLEQLYIKDSSSFYFANLGEQIDEGQTLTLRFNESDDVLNSLECRVSARLIEKGSGEYEDALLFFHLAPSKVKELLCLTLETLSVSESK